MLFSSERTGWAPPGPGVLASPLLADGAVLPPAAGVLLADALSALARAPPLMTPAASRPTAPAHRFLRPRVFAESDMVISFSCRGRPRWRPWHHRAFATCPLRQIGLCAAYDHFQQARPCAGGRTT